ncbi:MAG: hypothetical protein Ct9H300mP19_19020 [Dehalococcoidia bacterium]|nr:MAG: hypothetical protein Ct9H300mP19_19020 [Dehalococcoidia bacterium]
MRFPLTVDFGWPGAKPNAEYLKPQLKKIGIDIEVRHRRDFRRGRRLFQIGSLISQQMSYLTGVIPLSVSIELIYVITQRRA